MTGLPPREELEAALLAALRKYEAEQVKNRNRVQLIWAIVLKHGGEIRLSAIEQGKLRDDWELLEYTDMETFELVLKARIAPNITPMLQRVSEAQLEI